MIALFGMIGGFILFVLGILHFHWAVGGDFGFENSLPTNEEGVKVLNPKKRDSAVVGFGLCFFSILFLVKSSLITFQLPSIVLDYGLWLVIVIFSLRTIGDFKYIGMFKKVKNTPFADMDTKFYIPLCISLAIMGLMIEVLG